MRLIWLCGICAVLVVVLLGLDERGPPYQFLAATVIWLHEAIKTCSCYLSPVSWRG